MDHLQRDQGTEFKGVEKTLCETLKVPIIKTALKHKKQMNAYTEHGKKR